MPSRNNAKKGKAAEQRTAKKLGATRKAGPNQTDLKKGKLKIEVKTYKKPLTVKQLQKTKAQNRAEVVVSESGFTPEALEHAKKKMPGTQLRSGKSGKKLVKRRSNSK